MIVGTIEFTGKTLSDVEDAIREALARICDGNTSGWDHNESGSFSFDVSGEEEEDTDEEEGGEECVPLPPPLSPPTNAPLYPWPDILEQRVHHDFLTNGTIALLFAPDYADSERDLGYCLYLVDGQARPCDDEGCQRHGIAGKRHLHAKGWGVSNEFQVERCLQEVFGLTQEQAERFLSETPWWIATGREETDGFHWNFGWEEQG